MTALHPGVTREQVEANTGWPVRFAEPLEQTPPPTAAELSTLRDLQRRTAEAHAAAVIPSERSESRDLHPGPPRERLFTTPAMAELFSARALGRRRCCASSRRWPVHWRELK